MRLPTKSCRLESFGMNGRKAQQFRKTKTFKGVLSVVLKYGLKVPLLLLFVHVFADFSLSLHPHLISTACRLIRAVAIRLLPPNRDFFNCFCCVLQTRQFPPVPYRHNLRLAAAACLQHGPSPDGGTQRNRRRAARGDFAFNTAPTCRVMSVNSYLNVFAVQRGARRTPADTAQ